MTVTSRYPLLLFSMKNKLSKYCLYCLTTAVLIAVVVGCVSRYRLDLYLETQQKPTKVKIEQTNYVPGTVLLDPYAEKKIVSGDGSTAVLTVGFRGKEVTGLKNLGIGFDEYIKYLLFFQLPSVPKTAAINLTTKNSFVQLLGHYELRQDQKIFLPTSGTLTIDSVSSGNLYCTINGQYENAEKNPVHIYGRFKVKTQP